MNTDPFTQAAELAATLRAIQRAAGCIAGGAFDADALRDAHAVAVDIGFLAANAADRADALACQLAEAT